MKILFNVLGVLLGIFAAFLLFLALFFTPLVSASTKMLQPKTIQELLDEMNLQKELQKIVEQNTPIGLDGVDTALVEDLINSELMEELLGIYIENLLGILEEDDVNLLSNEHITPLLKKHLPEMTDLIKSHLPAEIALTDEQISEYTLSTLEPLLLEIASMLPTLEELGLEKNMISVVHYTYDKTILKYTLLTVVILSAIILFLRYPRFKGFMWLTVIYGFFTLLYFCIYKYCFMEEVQQIEEIPVPILEFLGIEYQRSALICFICTVVFLVTFFVGRKVFKPKEFCEFTSLEDSF